MKPWTGTRSGVYLTTEQVIVAQLKGRRLVSGEVLSGPERGEALGIRLGKLLRAPAVSLALPETAEGHTQLELPPMSGKDLRLYLSRMIKKEEERQGQPLLWSSREIGQGPKSSGPIRVQMVSMSRAEGLARVTEVEERGLRVTRLTTLALSLVKAAATVPGVDSSAWTLLIHCAEDRTAMVVSRQGAVVLAREIPVHGNAGLEVGEVSLEAQRTLMTFRKESRGERVESILLCVPPEAAGACHAALAADLGLPVGEFLPVIAGITPENVVPLLPAVGAALAEEQGDPINLLPRERVAARRGKLATAGMVAASTVIFFSAGLTIRSLASAEKTLKGDLARIRAERTRLEQQVAEGARLSGYRQWLGPDVPGSPLLVEFLAELSRSIPSSAALTSLTVTRQGDGWKVSLTGFAHGSTGFERQESFNRLYLALLASPLVTDLKFSFPPPATPGSAATPVSKAPQAGPEPVKTPSPSLEFKIEGVLRQISVRP